MRFWYITVMEAKRGGKQIFGPKKCLTVQECNELLKAKKLEYPAPEFQVYKESY